MKPSDFSPSAPGRLTEEVGLKGRYWAFEPNPLPPHVTLSSEILLRLSDADRALGELKGIGRLLPNPRLFIAPFVRREAVSSSRIEGTTTDLPQLLLFEADPNGGGDSEDHIEVFNYVRSLTSGLKKLESQPVSLRFMREIHAVLMDGARGADKRPGEFRQIQNMIGREGQSLAQARFVPPAVLSMRPALDELEKYINRHRSYTAGEAGFPILIDLALIHYQFETIHPFEDGNGRLGRLLITLLLCERKCLDQPLLYLSAYLEKHHESYYDLMLQVSMSGAWEPWIDFFLLGVATQAKAAVRRATELWNLMMAYRSRFQAVGRSTNLLKIIDLLFEKPVITITGVKDALDVTFPTAQGQIKKLVEHGVLTEVTGRTKNRVFLASQILALISKDDEDI